MTPERKAKLFRIADEIGPLSVEVTSDDINLMKKAGVKGDAAMLMLQCLLSEKLAHEERKADLALSMKDAEWNDLEVSP